MKMTNNQVTNQQILDLLRSFKNNFPKFSKQCLNIKTKQGGIAQFKLNQAQRIIHEACESQLRRTGKVRKLILKARQMGSSTYVQGRLYWNLYNSSGKTALIIAHDSDTSEAIFQMTKTFQDKFPELIKVKSTVDNVRELQFKDRDNKYHVLTAGSNTAGRGITAQYLAGSEVAYWKNADENWTGVLQTVADMPNTEIILESTSAGPNGRFYEACIHAHKNPQDSEFELIFLPWFLMDEYSEDSPNGFEPNGEEKELQKIFHLTNNQIYWRRKKLFVLGRSGFQREYPSTIEEAFKTEALGALWSRETINRCRVNPDEVPELKQIVVGIDPAATSKKTSDQTGIILFGIGVNNHGYVFEDRTGTYKPEFWATEVIKMAQQGFRNQPANVILAETNQGGEMIESVLRHAGSKFYFKGTHVLQSKRARAEPVAQLYSLGMIHHVGVLGGLEDEMLTWQAMSSTDSTGKFTEAADKSPNRIDALVRCVLDTMDIGQPGILGYYEQVLKEHSERPVETSKTTITTLGPQAKAQVLPKKNIFNTF